MYSVPGEATLIFPSIYILEYEFEGEVHRVVYHAKSLEDVVKKCLMYEYPPAPAVCLRVTHLRCGTLRDWFGIPKYDIDRITGIDVQEKNERARRKLLVTLDDLPEL